MSIFNSKHVCRYRITHCGFTLIELLVVMVVIMILTAILFPVFIQAKRTAKRCRCLSNLRQLSIGLRLYREDYDNQFPPQHFDGWELIGNSPARYIGSTDEMWIGQIGQYVKNTSVMICADLNPRTAKSINGVQYGIGFNNIMVKMTGT